MAKRLGPAIARHVTVCTFHSLGMAIIGEAEGKRPALAATAENDRTLFELLKGIVADLLADRELSATLREWFQERFAPYKSEHEFRNWGEYHDYIRKFDIRSLKGETVRSFEECEIANFLYLNGNRLRVRSSLRARSGDFAEKRQYRPDFHLPEHGIYIEHFGIDAAGNTAPFVDREQYRLGNGVEAWRPCRARHRLDRDLQSRTHRRQAAPQPDGEARGPWCDALADPARGCVRRSRTTGADRSVHAAGGDLPAALQGQSVVLCRRRGTRRHPPGQEAGAGFSRGVPTDIRALPGSACPLRGDRLPRHDQPCDQSCGGRTLPQPVRIHPGRRVPGYFAVPCAAVEGAPRQLTGGPVVRGRRRLAGDLPVRRLGHRESCGSSETISARSSASISLPRSAAPTASPQSPPISCYATPRKSARRSARRGRRTDPPYTSGFPASRNSRF